jgi:hypothetical protein
MQSNVDLSVWLPVLSLVIAALAVFFGPLISLRIAKRQIEASLAVTIRQTIAPMRQKWIDDLRERVAEYGSVAGWFYKVAHTDDKKDIPSNEVDQTSYPSENLRIGS